MERNPILLGFVALMVLLALFLQHGEGQGVDSSTLGPELSRMTEDVSLAQRERLTPIAPAQPREVMDPPQTEVSDVDAGDGATEIESHQPEFEPLSPDDVAALELSYEGVHAQATRSELFESLQRSYSGLQMDALAKIHAAKLAGGDYVVVSKDPISTANGGVSHELSGAAVLGVPGLTMIHSEDGSEIRQTQIEPADFPEQEGELIYLRWLSSKLRGQ